MMIDSKWAKRSFESLCKMLLASQIKINEYLAKVYRSMMYRDIHKACAELYPIVPEFDALKSLVEIHRNVNLKTLFERYELSHYENRIKFSVSKISTLIEKAKGSAIQFRSALLMTPPNIDLANKQAEVLHSTTIIDLANALSEYKYLCLTIFFEAVVLSVKERRGKIEDLLQKAKRLGLDENWALSSLCLLIQEIAAKKKMRELGGKYVEGKKDSEGKDMDAFRQLLETYKLKGKEAPEVLISIAKSWTFHRAKLIHEGHKADRETARALLEQTTLLLKKMRDIL